MPLLLQSSLLRSVGCSFGLAVHGRAVAKAGRVFSRGPQQPRRGLVAASLTLGFYCASKQCLLFIAVDPAHMQT